MRLLLSALFAGVLCSAQPASAQALPDNVRAAGVTVAQWRAVQDEVQRAAAARGASERALAAVAERVSANLVVNGRFDLDQVLVSIDERAQQVAELQSQLTAMQQADDPAVAALLSQARAAIEVGDLTRGDQLLAQAAQSDLAGIARDRARLAARQTRAAQTVGERGRLAYIAADYLSAATFYAQSAQTAPDSDAHGQWMYRRLQAASLLKRGELFGETTHLREAVRIYREVLPLVPRAMHPADWAMTHHYMGHALRVLGERGDNQALEESIIVFRAALEVRTRSDAPSDWATIQGGLGTALFVLGDRGNDQALRDAIVAFRAAIEVDTRERAPALWAIHQTNLANALRVQGERSGAEQPLRESVAAYRAVLEIWTSTNNPERWALVQANLGNALMRLGDEQAVHDAITAHRAALEVHTRERSPVLWARGQNNLGVALTKLGERGDDQALRDAVSAFRAALEVRTRSEDLHGWADSQLCLANALGMLVDRGDSSHLDEALASAHAALEGYQQTHDAFWIGQAQTLIGALEAMR
ncbi:MAG: hypothetical protein A4S17_01860 [Proteobacteria bacterium HN_bin10]|nr:MAG: hypothetical protein A4S17_01860 [Proteobacteria bacterium HN_bin10]